MNIKSFDIELLYFNGKCKLFTFVNPYSYNILNNKGNNFLDSFVIFSDGISFVKIFNLFNDNKIERYSFDFTSLAPIVFEHSITNNLKVAIIGGDNDEIIKAKYVIEKKYPKINICYYAHGYIKNDIDSVILELDRANVDIIIAGLGTPFQEDFILSCSEKVKSLKLAFTCGGFISQISNNENYFHPFFDRLHLRWAQRFFRHSYVRKRMLFDYPRFFINYIWNNINGK